MLANCHGRWLPLLSRCVFQISLSCQRSGYILNSLLLVVVVPYKLGLFLSKRRKDCFEASLAANNHTHENLRGWYLSWLPKHWVLFTIYTPPENKRLEPENDGWLQKGNLFFQQVHFQLPCLDSQQDDMTFLGHQFRDPGPRNFAFGPRGGEVEHLDTMYTHYSIEWTPESSTKMVFNLVPVDFWCA